MICTEKKKVKVHTSKRTKWTELIPVSLAWSMPRSIATPHWDRMQVQRKVTLQQYITSTHLYHWVKRSAFISLNEVIVH